MAANNSHSTAEFIQSVMSGDKTANVSILAFRDPETFRAGNLHLHASSWEHLASAAPYCLAYQVCDWIKSCVNMHDFFQHFKGSYKGESFDLPTPPRVFYNSVSCPIKLWVGKIIQARN